MTEKYMILKPTRDGVEVYAKVDSFTAAIRHRELAISKLYESNTDPDEVLIVKEVDWRTTEEKSNAKIK